MTVGSGPIGVAHKVFVVVVSAVSIEASLVGDQPPSSLSLFAQIPRPLQIWTVLPIVVDSFRRRQTMVEIGHQSGNICRFVYPAPRDPVPQLGSRCLHRVRICMKPLNKGINICRQP